RFLLPAGAFVPALVLTACGAGSLPASQVTKLGGPSTMRMSARTLAVMREELAARKATPLLRRFVPPAGARPVRAAPRPVLRSKPSPTVAEVAGPHRFFVVARPLPTVEAAVVAHPPNGFSAREAGESLSPPMRLVVMSPRPGADPTHFLTVTMLGLRGRTFLRVDADVVWTYPRSAGERLPAGIREISIRTPRTSATVTASAEVAAVVRWFDALPVVPPGVAQSCPLTVDDVVFSFRAADGKTLATAQAPEGPASYCNAIGFSIGGRRQSPALEDASRNVGVSFVGRVQRLIGARLIASRR